MKIHEPKTHELGGADEDGMPAVFDALLRHDGYGQAGFRNGQVRRVIAIAPY